MFLITLVLVAAFQSEGSRSVISDIVVNRLNYENEIVLAEVTVKLGSPCHHLKKINYRYDRDRGSVLLYPEVAAPKGKCDSESAEGEVATDNLTQWIPLGRFPEGDYEIRDLKSLRVLEGFQIAKGPSVDQQMITLLKN